MAPAPAGAGGSGSLQLSRAPESCLRSVVLRKHHRGEGSFPLPPDVVGDDPELAVLGREVAGEEAPITAAGSLIVGGLVVLAKLAPVACGMAIEQGGDLVVGHGGGHGGGGHHTAEVVEHGGRCGGGEGSGAWAAPLVVAAVCRPQAVRAWGWPWPRPWAR
jgi:hypothetical protein